MHSHDWNQIAAVGSTCEVSFLADAPKDHCGSHDSQNQPEHHQAPVAACVLNTEYVRFQIDDPKEMNSARMRFPRNRIQGGYRRRDLFGEIVLR